MKSPNAPATSSRLALACYFATGAAGIVVELVALRLLSRTLGAAGLAVPAVLAALMGGLAAGSALGARAARKLEHRPDGRRAALRGYAACEIAVALSALALPSLVGAFPPAVQWVREAAGAASPLVPLARVLLAMAALALPATAMGMTLPFMAHAAPLASRAVGVTVGTLYALNTAGAVAGATLGGFVLMPWVGVQRSLWTACAVDLLAAAAVFAWTRQSAPEASAPPPPAPPRAVLVAALAAASAAGFSALLAQSAWNRALSVVLGSSHDAFTAILVAVLAGIAAGGAAGARLTRGTSAETARARAAVVLLIVAAGVLYSQALVDRLPLAVAYVHASWPKSALASVLGALGIAALALAPATVASGAAAPLLAHALAAGDLAGRAAGRVFAANTLGALAGGLFAFAAMPLAGVQRLVCIAAAVAVAGALALRTRPGPRFSLAALALIAAAALWPDWDVARWTAGHFRSSGDPAEVAYTPPPVAFHRDGRAATVTVQQVGDTTTLRVDGKADASNHQDQLTQRLLGLLPHLLHPRPARWFVIGCGSAMTAGSALAGPALEQLALVELEPAVLEAARFFDPWNGKPWADPRLEVRVDDGRQALLEDPARWDVIVSEPSNPWMRGAAALFTREFFELERSRLEDGGVVVQWFQVYELSEQNVLSILRTFAAVFPHVALFRPPPPSTDFIAVGSERELRLDDERIVASLRVPELRAQLARMEVANPYDLFTLYVFGDEQLRAAVGPGPVLTDDDSTLEFWAPRELVSHAHTRSPERLTTALDGHRRSLFEPARAAGATTSGDGLAWLAAAYASRGGNADAREAIAAARASGGPEDELRTLERVLELTQGPLIEPVRTDPELLRDDRAYAEAVGLTVAGDYAQAFEALKRVQAQDSVAVGRLAGRLQLALGDALSATAILGEVLKDPASGPNDVEALYLYGRALYAGHRYRPALAFLHRYVEQAREQP